MTLDDYLTFNPGAARTMASALGVDNSTFWRWRRGRTFPPPWAISEIEHLTGGAVAPADWYTSTESRP